LAKKKRASQSESLRERRDGWGEERGTRVPRLTLKEGRQDQRDREILQRWESSQNGTNRGGPKKSTKDPKTEKENQYRQDRAKEALKRSERPPNDGKRKKKGGLTRVIPTKGTA